MNELGMTLAWLAVQVTLVLAPGIIAYALAARRGPAAGASAATLGLAMVVVLSIAAFLPAIEIGRRDEPTPPAARAAAAEGDLLSTAPEAPPTRGAIGRSPLQGWRVAWDRLGRGAAGPVERCRPWSGALAVLLVAGSAAGLLRLAIGLAAVSACRWRSRPVDDPAMIGLLDDLSRSIGCRAPIELREADDLVGPAAAGWRRPSIFLPGDWRSWDESERRAVLGHELAHIIRGDYAAGLIARVAVALNGYHPMVRWLAGRLRLQQELAADAIGAHLAGSRSAYLVALSRLALSQDGRSPSWPARAFLPARGTLIRRIGMLRQDSQIGTSDRQWTRPRRLATTAVLLATTAAVMTLRGPARGGEGVPTPAAEARLAAPANPDAPPLYLREGAYGAIVFRPAAAARHPGIGRLVPFLDDIIGFDLAELSKSIGVDIARPGFIRLGADDLEWATFRLGFGRAGKGKDGTELHRTEIGSPTFRTVAPFDWLAFLRQWKFEFAAARHGGQVYYKVTGPLAPFMGPNPCVYLPDDRTLVVEGEEVVRELIGRGAALPPAFLRGPDWERACRGLLAVAISNEGGRLEKGYDLGRPDDAVVLTLLKGVDHWTFSVDDDEAIVLRAAAACGVGDAAAIARTIAGLVNQGREGLDRTDPKGRPGADRDAGSLMSRALLAGLRVEHSDRSVALHAEGFGSLADFASIIEAEVKAQAQRQAPKPAQP